MNDIVQLHCTALVLQYCYQPHTYQSKYTAELKQNGEKALEHDHLVHIAHERRYHKVTSIRNKFSSEIVEC